MIINNWQIKKIKEVAGFNELNINDYKYQEIEYIDIGSVKEGRITEKKIMKFDDAPSRAKRILRNNDIIISTVRPNLKHYAYIKDVKENTICSTGFVVITPKKIDPRFLYYYLTQNSFTEFLTQIAVAHTSAYPAFNPDIIENSEILLPEIDEQKNIGEILYSIDRKIEINSKINNNLEQISQLLFKHWFVDFEFPNKQGQPYKSSGGEFIDSEIGKIPIGWKIYKLKEFGEIICGKTPPKSNKNYFNGDIPFIKIPDMHNNVFILKTEDSLTEEGKKFQENKTITAKSIIVSCIATVGLVSITSSESQTNQQINSLIPFYKSNLYYLYFKLKTLKDYFNTLGSSGSATLNINTKIFSNVKVIMPTNDILEKFNKIVSQIFNSILLNSRENLNLIQIRETLLPKLITGKIRVNLEYIKES